LAQEFDGKELVLRVTEQEANDLYVKDERRRSLRKNPKAPFL
jgi:hypothetical protein